MHSLYYPAYKKFICLAKDCPMNCCRFYRISFFKWEEKKFGKGDWADIDGKGNDIRHYLEQDAQGWFCRRKDDKSCVFLNNEDMCSIQRRIGPQAMPSVCRTYPRLITRFDDRIEFSLDPCCPQAVRLLENCEPWAPEVEGVGPLAGDGAYQKRARVLALFADRQVNLEACIEALDREYEVGRESLPHFEGSATFLEFVRKVTALLIFSYVLPYDGFPAFPSVAHFILDALERYAATRPWEKEETFSERSFGFARFLIDYVEEVGFDVEFEDRYIDSQEV